MAAPDFDPSFTLNAARIYAAQEQLADLVPGSPGMELGWLDLYLMCHGRSVNLKWIKSRIYSDDPKWGPIFTMWGQEVPDPAVSGENAALKVLWGLRRDPMHFESIAEKVDPSGFSFMAAYFRVWGKFVEWRNNLLEEEESNGSSEEARERQTEEPR